MERPIEIVFDGMAPSSAVEARIHEEADKLEQFFDHMTGMRVVISLPHRHHGQGNKFDVRLQISIPSYKDVIVSKGPGKAGAHEDAYVTIRDAFKAARRQLQDRVRKMEGQIKTHEAPPQGRIAKLFPSVNGDDGYGFIDATDGSGEIYFHEHAVSGIAFADLKPGDAVRYSAEDGNEGLQAAVVHPA